MKKILITCGETSSELIASRLTEKLLESAQGMEILSLGSRNMEEAGAKVLFRLEDYSVMGFWEVFKVLPRFLALERSLKSIISSGELGLFIPVDFPGLNLRLSAFARKCGVPVLYFISPQVWAWGGWRIKKIKRVVDLMAVLFPFEEELYRKEGIDVVLVRHPILDMVHDPGKPKELPPPGERIKVVLFPGSRRQEVSRMLPVLLGAARAIRERFNSAEFVVGAAPMIDRSWLEIPDDMQGFTRVTDDGLGELVNAALVIASSGTVTLQSAISATPTIVIYRTSMLTYIIGKTLVKVRRIAMPNLLADEALLPELIQREAVPERVADEASVFLTNRELYGSVSERLLGLRKLLRGKMDIQDLAAVAVDMIAR